MSAPAGSPTPKDGVTQKPPVRRSATRKRIAWVTVALLATVAVVGVAWDAWPAGKSSTAEGAPATPNQPVEASTSTPTPTPTSSATSTPTSSPSAPISTPSPSTPATPNPPPLKDATVTVSDFLAATAIIAPDAPDTADQLAKVAAGSIIAEIENDQQELVANGWTQKGTPIVDSLSIVSNDATATPPSAVVQACIDSSAVVTFDSDGKPLAGPGDAKPDRALNIFKLQRDGTSWRVTARSFPNDTTC